MTQALHIDNAYKQDFVSEILEIRNDGIVLKESAFYATGGGQPGDTGYLTLEDGNTRIDIADTRKDRDTGTILHVPANDLAGNIQPGIRVSGAIDWDRRYAHMRMHSALHLLCSLIEGDVTGGQIGAEKSRLDFNIPGEGLDKDRLGEALNTHVAQDHTVTMQWITDEDLRANTDLVRTMSVMPPTGAGHVRLIRIGDKDNPVDLQPCGGTHVRSTGEIGRLQVNKIENKGKQNRRISIIFDNED